MQNLYFLLPTNKIKDLEARAVTKSPYPHQNVHYAFSADGREAIVQGDFSDQVIVWLNQQAGSRNIGQYAAGAARKEVHEWIAVNSDKFGQGAKTQADMPKTIDTVGAR